MSKVNQSAKVAESKRVVIPSVKEQARRSLMTCLLWEDTFYEDGVSIADRIKTYVSRLSEEDCRELLKEAKLDNKLRHAPLLWAVQMAKEGKLKADDVNMICDRVDLMEDLLALYFAENKLSDEEKAGCYDKNGHRVRRDNKAVPKSITKGLQKAFNKFDEYQFAKYRADSKEVKLKDVLRIAHVKPSSDEQSALFKKILDGTLATPDTWEVAISAAGRDEKAKREAWVRLLTSKTDQGYNKLGTLALLRNLRGMSAAGVSEDIIRTALKSASIGKTLPFQIVTASRAAANMSDILNDKFKESIKNIEKLPGKTLILVDVSGSMTGKLSERGETSRVDVAAALGALTKEISDEATIYGFDTRLYEPSRDLNGLPLVRALTIYGGSTAVVECTDTALSKFREAHGGKNPDRVIVVTDAQDNSSYMESRYYIEYEAARMPKLDSKTNGYIINVAPYKKRGVEYTANSGWSTVYGWSDSIVKYIASVEASKSK